MKKRNSASSNHFTTKKQGKGTGLGLSTVFGIVRQHDGMVHVYTELGVGTTLRIYLPMVNGNVVTVKKKVAAPTRGGTETILLADDDDGVRNVAKRMLQKAGYTVLTASDGEEAKRILDEHIGEIHLAVLDLVMPKIGGKAVFTYIQEKELAVRVLFASGYSTNGVHSDFVLEDGMHLIQKPYQRENLLRQVRHLLDS